MQPFRLTLVAALWLASAAGAAIAAEPPENVAGAVKEAAAACVQLGGKPNTDAILKADDLNGDGGEDWIADYSKLKCEGKPNPLCGDGGCTLQIYFWDGESGWDVVFEDLIETYKLGKADGKPMLYVTTPGTPCNKPVTETCKYSYRLDKDTVTPVK